MNARDRRALRVGAAMVLGAWLVLRLVPAAVRAEQVLSERVARQATTVARLKADLAALPVLEDSAAAVSRSLAQLAPRLVTGSTRAEGEAELAVLLRSLAESLGARVERVVPAPDSTPVGALTRVTLRVEAETDTRGVARLLGSIASQPTVLDITSLRVLALDPGSAATAPERLRMELGVSGWVLRTGAKRATGRGRS